MSDIAEDLRSRAKAYFAGTCTIFYEDDAELDRRAADEIERLREEVAFKDMGWLNQTHVAELLKHQVAKLQAIIDKQLY